MTNSRKYSTPDLSVIILNYNAEPFLPDLFNSLKKQKGINLQVILVDNNSSDNSVSLVQQKFPWVELVKRDTSIGFSAGNNAGLKKAKADLILFLNPDMILSRPTDLKKCVVKYRKTPRLGILSPKIILAVTGGIDETCHRGFPTPWASFCYFTGLARRFPNSKFFSGYLETYKGYDTEHEVDSVGGMFILMSKKIGSEVGWWDEDYPLYGEDIDLCYRVKEKGYKILYWPEVSVLHYKGASTGMSKHSKSVTTAKKSTTNRVKSWSIEAMQIFYRKHYSKKYSPLTNFLVALGIRMLKFKRTRL